MAHRVYIRKNSHNPENPIGCEAFKKMCKKGDPDVIFYKDFGLVFWCGKPIKQSIHYCPFCGEEIFIARVFE